MNPSQPLLSTKSSPKVAVLVHENGYGGGGRQSFYILESMVQQGYNPVLISNSKDGWLGQEIQRTGLPISTYFSPSIQRPIHPVRDMLAFLFIMRVLWKEKPKAVLTSGVKLIGLGALAAWLLRIPKRYAMVRGHGAPPGSRMAMVIHRMKRLVTWLGTRFIAVSEYNRQDLLAQKVCPPEGAVTIHNGADVQRYDPRLLLSLKTGLKQRLGLPADAVVIGMVGRLTQQKGYDRFIRFMSLLCKRFPNVYGLLIGEGPERTTLESLIRETSFSDRILITGYMAEMSQVYADLDLSVLFTNYEGCANALIESLAAGVPVIAEDVCGNSEIVAHGQNGFVVTHGDVETAVQAAKTLLLNPDLAKKFGEAGRKRAIEEYNRDIQIEKLIRHLDVASSDTVRQV